MLIIGHRLVRSWPYLLSALSKCAPCTMACLSDVLHNSEQVHTLYCKFINYSQGNKLVYSTQSPSSTEYLCLKKM